MKSGLRLKAPGHDFIAVSRPRAQNTLQKNKPSILKEKLANKVIFDSTFLLKLSRIKKTIVGQL